MKTKHEQEKRYRVGGSRRTFTLDEAKKRAAKVFEETKVVVAIEEQRTAPTRGSPVRSTNHQEHDMSDNKVASEAAYLAAEFIETNSKHVLGEEERAVLTATILEILKGERS